MKLQDQQSLKILDSRHVKATEENFLSTNEKITQKVFDQRP